MRIPAGAAVIRKRFGKNHAVRHSRNDLMIREEVQNKTEYSE